MTLTWATFYSFVTRRPLTMGTYESAFAVAKSAPFSIQGLETVLTNIAKISPNSHQ